jgi:uracil-DNA glycosylase family protein
MTSLMQLRTEAARCTRCELYANATQTVFGEGPRRARVMMVGEQPGDQEDRQGRPFVGPAGQLLERALAAAGIDRRVVYVTNAVKHFKWEPRGKRRLHVKPNARELAACRPWLDGELAAVKPELLVCLGATAAQALLGRAFRVTRQRGLLLPSTLAPRVLATVHPSSILRAPDATARQRQLDDFVADLRVVAAHLAAVAGAHAP